MQSTNQPAPPSRKLLWAGRIVTGLTVLFLLLNAVITAIGLPHIVESLGRFGYAETLVRPIGIILFVCTTVYLIPHTAVLGAILLTGYLGGATASHVRINDTNLFPVFVGMLVWLGLFLRDGRLRALLPLRR